MKADLGDLMKQAQQMQGQMQKAQDELIQKEVIGESGAGMVKVVMNGRHDVKRVEIDPDLMNEDKEMLEDLLAAAVNDAVHRIEKHSQDNLSKMTSGLGLPSNFKMPF